jgi:nucleotide-binding universal stress UspA family protein
MTDVAGRSIVVGVDGSADSLRAARWAVGEARLRGCAVRLVCVYTWPMPLDPLVGLPSDVTEEAVRRVVDAIVADALEGVRDIAGDVLVSGAAVPGLAAAALVDLSDNVGMLVVGHRGQGGFAALGLGSVAAKLAAHARCPVAVIRPAVDGETTVTGAVLVGVDGSPQSDAAFGFAFDEAERRGTTVTALHAWEPPGPPPPGQLVPWEVLEARRLREWVQPWRDKYPNVMVEQYVTSDRPAAALVDAARDATLLVVGCRGHGGFAGLMLGSVSQQVIHHVPCPVVIVR